MRILFVLIFMMSACMPTPQGDARTKIIDNYSIITIDSCEYIEYDMGILDQRVYSLTHKGNCKNTIHIHRKIF